MEKTKRTENVDERDEMDRPSGDGENALREGVSSSSLPGLIWRGMIRMAGQVRVGLIRLLEESDTRDEGTEESRNSAESQDEHIPISRELHRDASVTLHFHESELKAPCSLAAISGAKLVSMLGFGNWNEEGDPIIRLVVSPGSWSTAAPSRRGFDTRSVDRLTNLLSSRYGLSLCALVHFRQEVLTTTSPPFSSMVGSGTPCGKNDRGIVEVFFSLNPDEPDGHVDVHAYSRCDTNAEEYVELPVRVISGLSPYRECLIGTEVFPARADAGWEYPLHQIHYIKKIELEARFTHEKSDLASGARGSCSSLHRIVSGVGMGLGHSCARTEKESGYVMETMTDPGGEMSLNHLYRRATEVFGEFRNWPTEEDLSKRSPCGSICEKEVQVLAARLIQNMGQLRTGSRAEKRSLTEVKRLMESEKGGAVT